jgi:signal transduction histidine kinase/ActR/RegA family two-component response regulator
MSKRKNADDLRRKDVSRLGEDAGLLREEIDVLRQRAHRAKEVALASDSNPAVRMALLREANEKLVLATLQAQMATEVAEHANRDKEQFLAMLAHELRNPLAPINNALAILRRKNSADPTVTWVHDIIKRQVDHLTRLLNELLEASRLTTGKVLLKKRPIDISEPMRFAIEASQPLIRGNRQHLSVAYPAQPMVVEGDPTRLVQIFSNLLHNAAKYTQEGGSIRFAAMDAGGAVEVRVTDSGAGIAAEVLPHIFDLFTQEGRSLDHAQGGLGIGLTVVRSLVELHGGTVSATSPGLGLGSEFSVVIPLMTNPPLEIPAIAGEQLEAPGRSLRIVLIDDNVDANDSLNAVLGMMGHEVSTAFDGKEGFELIRDSHPQLVVCDIGLPGMDGYQIIKELRETVKGPLPYMIALTGYGQPEDRDRALTAGFDQHLTKPVDVEELLWLIAAHAERLGASPTPQPAPP